MRRTRAAALCLTLGLLAFGVSAVAQDGEVTPISGEAFRQEYGAVDRADADALATLGLRAQAGGLVASARQAFRAALRANPNHAVARAELGYVEFAGEWTTADAMLRERGLIQRGDKWVPVDSAAEPIAVEPAEEAAAAPEPEDEPASDDPDAWYDDHATIAEWPEAAVLKTKRYMIRSNIKSEYVQRYGKMLDTYFDRFVTVFKPVILPGTKYSRSLLTIYPDQESFLKTEKLPQGVGGFYRPTDRTVVTYHGRFGKTGNTRTVLGHEGTHQFQHLVLGAGFQNCPIWLIEGLAVLFESAEWSESSRKVNIGAIPRDRMDIMKQAVEGGKTIPLNDLFRTPQQQFSGFHYAHAWSIIYMLVYGAKTKKARDQNARIISELLTAGRKGRVRTRDVLDLFGGTEGLARFEEEWKEWIKETPFDFEPK